MGRFTGEVRTPEATVGNNGRRLGYSDLCGGFGFCRLGPILLVGRSPDLLDMGSILH